MDKKWQKTKNLKRHKELTLGVKSRLKTERNNLKQRMELIDSLLGKPTKRKEIEI